MGDYYFHRRDGLLPTLLALGIATLLILMVTIIGVHYASLADDASVDDDLEHPYDFSENESQAITDLSEALLTSNNMTSI